MNVKFKFDMSRLQRAIKELRPQVQKTKTELVEQWWEWVGLDYQNPIQTHTAICSHCRHSYEFELEFPQ